MKATALDMYNGTFTGQTTMTLCSARIDCHKIPCVLIEVKDDLSESDRSADGKQPSGELLRTGRIQ